MAEKKLVFRRLGEAKPDSRVYKRGFTIKLVPSKPAEKPAKKKEK